MPQSDYPILGAARQIYTHLLTNRNRGDNTLMLLQKICNYTVAFDLTFLITASIRQLLSLVSKKVKRKQRLQLSSMLLRLMKN